MALEKETLLKELWGRILKVTLTRWQDWYLHGNLLTDQEYTFHCADQEIQQVWLLKQEASYQIKCAKWVVVTHKKWKQVQVTQEKY